MDFCFKTIIEKLIYNNHLHKSWQFPKNRSSNQIQDLEFLRNSAKPASSKIGRRVAPPPLSAQNWRISFTRRMAIVHLTINPFCDALSPKFPIYDKFKFMLRNFLLFQGNKIWIIYELLFRICFISPFYYKFYQSYKKFIIIFWYLIFPLLIITKTSDQFESGSLQWSFHSCSNSTFKMAKFKFINSINVKKFPIIFCF